MKIIERLRLNHSRIFFLIILGIFTIIGFGMKWIWFNSGGVSPAQDTSTVANGLVKSKEITSNDVNHAQNLVITFMPFYFEQDKEKIKSFCTPELFALLQEEMENPLKKKSEILDKIDKVGCSVDQEGIRCFAAVRVARKTDKDNKPLAEYIYDIALLSRGTKWLIDEVNIRGDFE